MDDWALAPASWSASEGRTLTGGADAGIGRRVSDRPKAPTTCTGPSTSTCAMPPAPRSPSLTRGRPLAGHGELLLGARRDRLQRAHGRLDVLDVELAQQLVSRAGDGLAQAAVHGLARGRQVDLGVAADEPVDLEPGEQLARRVGVEVRRALEVAAQRSAVEARPARGDRAAGRTRSPASSDARRGAGAARPLSERSAKARVWPNWAKASGWVVMSGSVPLRSTGA